ncbi:unnamed protein product [Mytilus coruscus]|uniref:Uncharacterized protein n=1 Tax=Mytilus coruscus TaxID=42192 RepID=A0A6J8D464_MYTCO|nr:unnamed protein product [Mytilus coruscus]
MEINLFRAFFSFCRNIFLETLAEKLGFMSKRAKDFIVGCGDHHLTWQIFQIVLYAFAAELSRSYVISCLEKNETPTSAGFVLWVDEASNPNITMMYNIVFTFFLAMKCFRSGVRRNNSTFMLAGRQTAVPVMFIKKHTIYQNLICNDMAIRVNAPDPIKEYMEKNESFSVSGDPARAEGGDYVTENVNRALKNHLPPGVPTLQLWVNASRCNDKLDKIRKKVFLNAGLNEPSSDKQAFNVDNEVQMLRREIRTSKWLEYPQVDSQLRSLSGETLHPGLVNVLHVSRDNYKSYLLKEKAATLEPVFITNQDEIDFNDASNWTIIKLNQNIVHTIQEIDDENLSLYYKNYYEKNISSAVKKSHVDFYYEVKGILDGLQTVDVDLPQL